MSHEVLGCIAYVIVFGLATTLVYFGEKKKWKWLVVLGLALPILVAAFRGINVGTDTRAYADMYEQVTTEGWQKTFDERLLNREIEPFIVFISKLGGFLGFGRWWTFGIFSAITVIFTYLAITKVYYKNKWLLYGLFLFMVFPNSLNVMRQMAAMSILLYLLVIIFNMINERKKVSCKKIIGLALFAIILHYGSILVLPVFGLLLLYKKLGFKKVVSLVILLLTFLIPFLVNINLIVSKFGLLSEKHTDGLLGFQGRIFNFNFWIFCVIIFGLIIGFLKYKKQTLKKATIIFEIKILLMIIGTFYASIGFFSGYIGRLADFFWPVAIYISVLEITKYIKNRRMREIALLTSGVAYFIVTFAIVGINKIMPYTLIEGIF